MIYNSKSRVKIIDKRGDLRGTLLMAYDSL